MTLDDLVKVYERHGVKVSRPDLVAVVTALRDAAVPYVTATGVVGMMNEILASDGEGKAAGGSARENETYVGAGLHKGGSE